MTDLVRSQRALADPECDLQARIGALQALVDAATDGAPVTAVARQIDDELARDDTRFVIYLLGAVRRIYDRGAIDVFVDLLARPIDLSFRSQSILGLGELYRHSVRRWLLSHPRPQGTPAAAKPHLAMVDEHFAVHGVELTGDDRRRISTVLQATANDPNEMSYLRDEARDAYAMCHVLSIVMSE